MNKIVPDTLETPQAIYDRARWTSNHKTLHNRLWRNGSHCCLEVTDKLTGSSDLLGSKSSYAIFPSGRRGHLER